MKYIKPSIVLIAVMFILHGCVSAPPAATPMRSIRIDAGTLRAETLVIMLPGVGDRAQRFIETGFLGEGVERAYDLLAADAHLGYYLEGSIIERLRKDVVEPAWQAGYERIWLVGVSLGGFGSLLYMEEFPEEIEGVVLLAPYLGRRRLVREIINAGGLEAWDGTSRRAEPFELEAWRWLKAITAERRLPVILAYGESDLLAPLYVPLLQVLPEERVYTLSGGHGWDTWTELWKLIEASGEVR